MTEIPLESQGPDAGDASGAPLMEYPMRRSRECPFNPPTELSEIQLADKLVRVEIWDGTTPWLVTGFAEVRELLADPRLSSDIDRTGYPYFTPGEKARRAASKQIPNLDGAEHHLKRRMLTKEFSVKHTEAMRPRIQELVDSLIDAMIAGPNPTDLVHALALPLPSHVICDILGVPYWERDHFHALSEQIVDRDAVPEESVGAQQAMMDLLRGLIDQRIVEPGNDLIAH